MDKALLRKEKDEACSPMVNLYLGGISLLESLLS
jgi:hypothetical protein